MECESERWLCLCPVALGRGGLQVAVYEQATALTEVGAGFQLTPNALRLSPRYQPAVAAPMNSTTAFYASRYCQELWSACNEAATH